MSQIKQAMTANTDPTADAPSATRWQRAEGYVLHIETAHAVETRHLVGSGSVVIGRAADLVVDDPGVSRQHARLGWDDEGVWIKDLDSKHGTFLEDLKLDHKHAYRPRPYQRMFIGSAELYYSPRYQAARSDDPIQRDKERNKYLQNLSPAMQELYRDIDKAAKTSIPIVLRGETGVGKRVLSERVHIRSARSAGPFLSINSAAMPGQLLESELFGHVKGAFYGAYHDKLGLLEKAHNGTFFLDEIGDLSLESQAKILKAIDEGTIRPVGGNVEKKINVRFIAATNRDLEKLVQQGLFRMDLYHRLGAHFVIPPLRERKSELLHLAEGFGRNFAERSNIRPVPTLSADAQEWLLSFDWPGNVRQLQLIVELMITFSDSAPQLTRQHIADALRRSSAQVGSMPSETKNGESAESPSKSFRVSPPDQSGPLQCTIGELERLLVLEAIQRANGNISKAAVILGCSRSAFYVKMEKFEIQKPDRNGT